MDILYVDLNNIDLDYINYDEDDSDTIIIVRFWLNILNLKNSKHLKKDTWRVNASTVAS